MEEKGRSRMSAELFNNWLQIVIEFKTILKLFLKLACVCVYDVCERETLNLHTLGGSHIHILTHMPET